MSDIARILNEREEEPEDLKFGGPELGELVVLIEKGTISSAIAKKVLEELFKTYLPIKVYLPLTMAGHLGRRCIRQSFCQNG